MYKNDDPQTIGSISTQMDEADANFEPQQISAQQIDDLKAEAVKLKALFDKFEEDFATSETDYYYILSKPWLNKWKRYVSYNEITASKEPNSQFFGQIKPGEMNSDIVIDAPTAVKYPDDAHIANVFLKDQLQSEVDYVIVSESIWKELKEKYGGKEIKRPVIQLQNGQKRVEVRLKSFDVVFVNNQFFRNVDHGRVKGFVKHRVQVFSQATVKDFKEDILSVINSNSSSDYLGSNHRIHQHLASKIEDDSVRMWHLDPQYTLEQAYDFVKDICNKTTSYDYRVPFKGEYLEKFPEKKMEETNVADSDIVFIEIKEAGRNWDFSHADVPTIEKCDGCSKYGLLKYPCACGKAAYCSDECKQKDKRFHLSRCTKAEDEEETQAEIQETPQSSRGLTGLQNLGNTCFMNSGLQCLSNFKELTEYMLSCRFKLEINETNPLGTKGKLVKKYANLVRNLWYGTSNVFSPWSFKHGLAQFQPMFSGYQQHDSQEFLNFLLDGLHEDLNRVKDKPFVETLESGDATDDRIPKLSWYNHLKRNQSVIVDLLHGQFKSQLTCPECQRISITYDPFMSVSLPITAQKTKEIEFFYVHSDLKEKAYKITISFNTKDHLVKDLKQETAKLVKRDPSNFHFVFLSQLSKEVVTDEDKTSTNTLRKKKKIKNLFAIEVSPEDQQIVNNRIDVDFTLTKRSANYFGNVVRKPFTFMRTIPFETTYTTKQVYMKVFRMYRFLYDEYLPEAEREKWLKLTDAEAFKKIYEDKEPNKRDFKILLSTNTRGFKECYFCGNKRCENCELECSDDLRLDKDVIAKIKDKDFQLEMELYFENVPEEIDTGRLNTCVDLQKKMREERGEDPNKPGPTPGKEGALIYDCFKQFEQPEQLGVDNEWYCSKCKKHQRAFKKMEIYKAPPVLIVHLKRFKSGGGMSSGKIQTLVNFPTRDLDLTEYVTNHELPMDYPINMPPRTKAEQEVLAKLEKEHGIASVVEKKEEGKSEEATNAEESKTKDSKDNRLLYDLFGIVNHYGSTGFGHYTAYGKNDRTGTWYCFDDSSVNAENEQAVCTTAAYVLFYRRKDWQFNMPNPTPVATTESNNDTQTSETTANTTMHTDQSFSNNPPAP